MFNLTELTTGGNYIIQGQRGFWHYAGESRDKLRFWRWAMGRNNHRVSLALIAVAMLVRTLLA